ncbi:MAG: hypothetical protein Q8Q49_03715, partial [bacterium]|nr:hypothetical protein [bacterium]
KNSLTEADRAVVGDLSPEESRLFNDVLQASYFKTRNGVRGRQRVLQHPVDLSPDTPGFSQRVATSMPVEGMISYLTDRASELQSKIDVISHSISHGTASVEDTIQLAELTASKEDTVGRMMLIDESSRAFWDVKDRQQVKKRPDIDIMNLIVEDQAQLLRLKNAGFFDGKPSQEAILALAKSQLSQRRELVLPRIPRGGGGARNARAEASAEPEKQKWELDIWRGEEPALAEPERFFPEDSSRPDALTDTGYPSTEATDRGIDHGRDERLEELIRRAREGKRPSVRKSLGESELLGRAVGGDEAARGELIDRHVGRSSDRFETVLEQFTDAERRRGDEGERERARIARETPREELSEEPVVLTKPEGRLRRLGRRLRVWNPAETSIVPPLVVAGGLLANLVRGGQGGHEIRYEAKTPTSGTPSGLVATPRPSEAPGTPGTANASPSVGIGLTPEGEASPTARAVIEQINTMTATPKPYETATPIPPTPTEVATRVSTEEPTDVPEPSSIASPTNTPTNTPSPSETATVTPSPTSTPSPPSATPTETATPSPEPSLLTPTETATAEATATVETGTPTSKEAEEMVDGMAMIKIDEPKDSISKQMQDKLLIGTAGEKSMSMDEFKKMYNDPDAVAAFLLVNLPRFNKDWEADGLPQRTEEEILATRDKVKRGEATMDKLWGKQVTYNEAGEVADKGKAGIDRVILGSEYMVWITDEDWKKAQAIIFKAEEDGTLDTLRDTLRRMLKKKGDEEK